MTELTLFGLGIQAILQEPLEDLVDVPVVLFKGLLEYQKAVQVDEHMLVDDITENVIDEGLEDCRSISEPEHDHAVQVAARGIKSRLPLLSSPSLI